ncbi:hypothetical protein E2986_11354 [Frieseomelitta varia]|uniref:phospholipase A1 n=1 Tax=Frieseomelitta varia TaxID=561572 RepID=A0A833W263_9HYME|nr:hypothetical protein E2986_11354 [Frieseomelitta varia]
MKILDLAAFLFLYVATVRGNFRTIQNGILNIGEHVFEALDYGAEALNDRYIIGPNGIPIRIDTEELLFPTLGETQKNLPNTVFFYLYTRNNPTNSQRLNVGDENTLRNSNFNVSKNTLIYAHGWMANYTSAAGLRNAILKNCDCNVILLDWGAIAGKPYVWSSDRAGIISQYVAQMIDFLHAEGMDVSRLTIVGHSLGAHIAGLSSYYAKNKANFIVGLDPAQPNFLRAGAGIRLSSGDGNYVQVLHTNAGAAGFNMSLGDIDFWANNGQTQNGCDSVNVFGIINCSHGRAVDYYMESLNSRVEFIGRECDNYNDFTRGNCANNPTAVMGGVTPQTNLKGNFYFTTNMSPPYARGAE